MRARIVFLGGNGHCAARLDGARRALADRGATFDLMDAAYPGFEGRPPADGFEGFLDLVSDRIAVAGDAGPIYATGIGGLIALCLRSRGSHVERPLLLQAPVLWGLERRIMPRVLRRLPADPLLRFLFRTPAFQRRFARRHFRRPPDASLLEAFFDGYARCRALAGFFEWMGPPLLRSLEARFAASPGRLAGVTVWWGGHDSVVTPAELRLTETALGVAWPLRVFPEWGHYPMIDAPGQWIDALGEQLKGQGAEVPRVPS